jgi:hypothetical protein
MSIFKVTITNTVEGNLDTAILGSTGPGTGTSIQRTAYITGPNLIDRQVVDGETFTDCNYWLQYCYPNVLLENVILTCISNDGSPWSSTNKALNTFPQTYALTVAGGSLYAANLVDILGTLGSYATFAQITSTQSLSMRINGVAVFPLTANLTQIFNPGDFAISRLEFQNNASGAISSNLSIIVGCSVVATS